MVKNKDSLGTNYASHHDGQFFTAMEVTTSPSLPKFPSFELRGEVNLVCIEDRVTRFR